jgi:hypothetical protein
MRRVKSSGFRAKSEGILVSAQKAVLAGDLLSKGRDKAFAIDGDAKGGMDAVQELGDMKRGAGPLEYVMGHVNLRPTFHAGRFGRIRIPQAEAADGAELSFERGFKYGKNGILEIVVHGGLLSMAQGEDGTLRSVCQYYTI